MKIKKLNKNKIKLLRFELLKTKIYKTEKKFNYLLLKNIETSLRKALQIIIRYHIDNKKILFIGTSEKLDQRLKKLLITHGHIFLPELIWLNGIITNTKSSFKYLSKRYTINNDDPSNFLFSLKNQIDLIVILNEEANLTALKESSLKRIPTISLNSNNKLSDLNLVTYKVKGDYNFSQKQARKNLFFLMLNSLIKRGSQLKVKILKTALKMSEELEKKHEELQEKRLRKAQRAEHFRLKVQRKNRRARLNRRNRKLEQLNKNDNSA